MFSFTREIQRRAQASAFVPGCATLLALVVSGCHGTAPDSERQARAAAQTSAEAFRPKGNPPDTVPLTADSSEADFLRFALLHQPRVEAAFYDWQASVERITQERSLPDPRLTFELYIQNAVTSIMPGLMMDFPGPGKLTARAGVAAAESQVQYHAFAAVALQTAFAVKKALYELAFLQEKIRVNRETLSLLADLERLALAQTEVGKVTLQDVLRAQIERDRLQTDVASLEHSRQPAMSHLKAALGVAADQPDPPMPRAGVPSSPNLDPGELWSQALAHNPKLAGMEAEVRRAEAAFALARKSRVPDFSAGLQADLKASPVLYDPQFSVSLPIWRDKIAATLAEAQAGRKAAAARLTAEQIDLAVDFAEKSFALRDATRSLTLLQTQLLPKQRQSLEVARSGYLAGQIDFFNLTDAEQTLLRFALAEVEAREQRELALAELSLVIRGLPPPGADFLDEAAGHAPISAAATTSSNSVPTHNANPPHSHL